MSGPVIPHTKIRDTKDCSWTARLLARLVVPELTEDEQDEIVITLQFLADPRAEAPLVAIFADRTRPEALRSAAASVLRAGRGLDRRTLTGLIRDGDPVEQWQAMVAMEHDEAGLVATIAADPGHSLHRAAIHTMAWGFEAPRFQALKIAALAHPDARVREAAAETLLWDEPVAAEVPLLRALDDSVDAVAIAAAQALAYYPTRRVVLRLAEVRAAAGERGQAAAKALDNQDSFAEALQGPVGARRTDLLAWMKPVWDILALTEDDLQPSASEPTSAPRPVRQPLDAARLLRDLADPDGPWGDKLRRLRAEPSLVGPADRARLVPFLVEHPDPRVRGACGHLLAAWGEQAALLRLVGDPRPAVASHAIDWLAKTTPDAAVAQCARDYLARPWVAGMDAAYALTTCVAHTPRAEVIPLLTRHVLEDPREAVRLRAVEALIELQAAPALASLLPLLEAPPRVHWGVHLALLRACGELALDASRGLDALRDVDNADVQAALARAP
ncbi:hypothetical protein [Nannocystis bainbridge]|uniref:HEAT repeat protein n=1 Tax=Nannocystis bainbridge TaxID=2995303 RepID=A0ABT5DWH6_9BACT|nr:hypothetical protein [Nannocystis bainbridge]MDC0716761.1 hypothetical protein [Nannocystis bainbridge]